MHFKSEVCPAFALISRVVLPMSFKVSSEKGFRSLKMDLGEREVAVYLRSVSPAWIPWRCSPKHTEKRFGFVATSTT